MDVRMLEEFLSLAENLSFSEAAEQLNMTQSNLSKHIRALERELGGNLFDRTSRSVSLSEFGRFYLPYARKMTELYAESDTAVKNFLERRVNSFRLAVVRNLQFYDVDKILIGFHKAFPNCSINMIECDEREARNLFQTKQVNLFATYGRVNETFEHGFVTAGQSEVVVVLPETHPLSREREITVAQLRSEALLLPSRSTKMSEMILEALDISDPEHCGNIVYEGGSTASIEFVKAGMGISLQPKELVSNYPDKTIHYSRIVPRIGYRYGLGFRENWRLSRAESSLVQYLREYAGELSGESEVKKQKVP